MKIIDILKSKQPLLFVKDIVGKMKDVYGWRISKENVLFSANALISEKYDKIVLNSVVKKDEIFIITFSYDNEVIKYKLQKPRN